MTPIRHMAKDCGGIFAWYIGPKDPPIGIVRSKDFMSLEGIPYNVKNTPPSTCPACGNRLGAAAVLKRCFDEDLEPGFDVNKALG